MLRSMFSAISGLRAHQTKMDVIGNNIANVNTVGFKSSQTVFEDTLSQVIRAGWRPRGRPWRHEPGAGRPGRQGRRHHHQLDPGRDPVHRPLDRLHDRGRRLLRHPGRHRAAVHPGRLVRLRRRRQAGHPRRRVLQGWMADANGVVNTNGPIGDLAVPYGQIVNPAATTSGQRRGQPAGGGRHGHLGADRRHHVRQPGRARRRSSTPSPRTPRPTPGLLDVVHEDGTQPGHRRDRRVRRCRRARHPGRPRHHRAVHPAAGDLPQLDRPGRPSTSRR